MAKQRVDTWTTDDGRKLLVYIERGRVSVSTATPEARKRDAKGELVTGSGPFVTFSEADSARIIERLGYNVSTG